MTPDLISLVQRANTQLAESSEPLAQFLMCELPPESKISEMIAAVSDPRVEYTTLYDNLEEYEVVRRLKSVRPEADAFVLQAALTVVGGSLLSLPRNAERTVALRALVEAKEAASRACRLKPMPLGSKIPV